MGYSWIPRAGLLSNGAGVKRNAVDELITNPSKDWSLSGAYLMITKSDLWKKPPDQQSMWQDSQ
jgi:hypothetical protein